MEKITCYDKVDGISLEHMVRYGKFDMRVKHFHNEYEIFYILEGERLFFFNNRNFVAGKGDLILIDSNLIHRIVRAGGIPACAAVLCAQSFQVFKISHRRIGAGKADLRVSDPDPCDCLRGKIGL